MAPNVGGNILTVPLIGRLGITLVIDAFNPELLNVHLAERSRSNMASLECTVPFSLADPPELPLGIVSFHLRSSRRSSPGPTEIPHWVFSEYWDILAPAYHVVWNRSLRAGFFPCHYKKSGITQLPKAVRSSSFDNVRGISVTPIPARLFERAVHKTFITPSIINKGDKYQFGYKPKISSVDCLLAIQINTLLQLDSKDVDGIHALVVDFSKAFDTINPLTTALKFPKFIDSPAICSWLYSFITGRSQRLIWQNKTLPYQSINLGCSQGTVGGPNIWNIASDDLKPVHATTLMPKLADDTTCLSPCYALDLPNPVDSRHTIMQEEFFNIQKWALENNLKLNTAKSKHIRFCLNYHPTCQCITGNLPVATVSNVKILGINFQQNIAKFNLHGDKLINSLSALTYIFKDLKNKRTNLNDMERVFQSIVISRVRYGISVYGSDTFVIQRHGDFLAKCHNKGYSRNLHMASALLRMEDIRIRNAIWSNPTHPLHERFTKRLLNPRTAAARNCILYRLNTY